VVAAVGAGASDKLEDRLAVAIAARHPYADRIFQYASPTSIPFGPFDETLPPTEERYLYRFRRADSIQRLSSNAALVNAVVRVPSLAPGPAPQRAPGLTGDPATRLRLRIPPDPRLTHVLKFQHAVISGQVGEAELLRVPNRPDLAPGAAVRLRLRDGTIIIPTVQALGPLPADPRGWPVSVDASGSPGPVNVWVSTLTADGVPSPPGGPWRVVIPKPPLAPPVLSMVAAPSTLTLNWTLPDPLITTSWLEVSTDGVVWDRASAVRQRPVMSATIARGSTQRRFRAVGGTQDGRSALSNVVEG
jgi:hypothetical protein